jgi:hypothetical protein
MMAEQIRTAWVEDEDFRGWYDNDGNTHGPVCFWLRQYGKAGPFTEVLGCVRRTDEHGRDYPPDGAWGAFPEARPVGGLFGSSPGRLIGTYPDVIDAMAAVEVRVLTAEEEQTQ